MTRSLITKLTLGSAVFFVLMGVLATMMITNILTNRAVVTHLSGHLLPETQAISAFHLGINGAMLEAQAFLSAGDPESRDEALAHVTEARTAFETIAALTADIQADDFDFRFLGEKQQLQAGRAALLENTSADVTRLITAVEQGDAVTIDTALAAMEASEDTAQTLEADTERLTATITTTVQADLERRYRRSILIAPAGLLVIAGIILGGLVWLRRRIGQLRPLAAAAQAVAQGDLTQHVPAVGTDEISTLQAAFNTMVQALRTQQAVLSDQTQDLQASVRRQQHLLETVSQLSTPLLPVAEGVVVLPIVGHVDPQRAEAIMHTLLHGVATQRARVAILDITGIALVDREVLHVLVQAMRGIELLGARAVVAGISSPMAQIMVEQGIDLGSLVTFADLRTAIEAASHGC